MPDRLVALGIGFGKCGTSSLCTALRNAGVRAGHQRQGALAFGPAMMAAYHAGEDPAWPVLESGFEAATQLDFVTSEIGVYAQLEYGMLAALVSHHPGVQYLVPTRPVVEHVASIDRWQNYRDLLVAHDLPNLPAGVGSTDAELAGWIGGHYKSLGRMFGDRLHAFDIRVGSEAKEALSCALGRPVPWWGKVRPQPGRAWQS